MELNLTQDREWWPFASWGGVGGTKVYVAPGTTSAGTQAAKVGVNENPHVGSKCGPFHC